MRYSVCLAAGFAAGMLAMTPRTSSAQAMDEWQVHREDGSYVYELQLRGLRGNSLLFQHDQRTVEIPLAEIDELRRIHKSFKHGTGGARATFGGLAGADDDVFKLSLYSIPQRHEILAKVLRVLSDSASTREGRKR